MTVETLKNIITQGEGMNTEFKTSFGQQVIVALNAFANSEGGRVLIGVADDGKIAGIQLAQESIASWINEIKSKTESSIIPDIEEISVDNKTVIVLSVKEFPAKPVSVQGKYYKRVKNSNHQLSLSEISDLYLKTFNSSWDYYIDNQHSLDDISVDKINRFISKRLHNYSQDDPFRVLQKYELMREGKITHAAFLLFVKDFTVLTGIQAGRFKSPTKIIDSVSINSDLFSEVDEVMAFLRKHFMTEYIITGNPQREERYDYPEDAIREIVLNMIVHRDYRDSGDSIIKFFDNKIEFFNPGKLLDGLTIERLLADNYTPKSRNILINTMFKEIGLVEKYGSGIQRIVEICKKHGGVDVDFFVEQHGFKVVVTKKEIFNADNTESVEKNEKGTETTEKATEKNEKGTETTEKNENYGGKYGESENNIESVEKTTEKSVEKKEKGTETTEKILNLIKENPTISQDKIAESIGITVDGVYWNIKKLKAKGIIERVGADRGGYWKMKTVEDNL